MHVWRIAAFASLFALTASGCHPVDVHFDDPLPRLRIQTRWQLQLTEPEPLAYYPREYAQPAYDASGRLVIAGTQQGDLVCADAHSGRERWRFETAGKIRGGALVRGDAVYFGATDGKLYRVDLQSGAADWESPYATRGAISSAPRVAGGKVIFQNGQNRTYAIDAQTGTYVWDQGRPAPGFLTIQGEGGVAVADGMVYAGYDDGALVAMRLDDGATVWSKSLAGSEQQFVDVDTRPILDGDVVFAGSFAVGLYALGTKHGDVKWLHRARGVKTPALHDGLLFVVTGANRVRALEPKTGKMRWEARLDYSEELGEPVTAGRDLFVPTGDGLVVFDASRGAVLARIAPDDGQSAPVSVRSGWLHMVTNSGALVGARLL